MVCKELISLPSAKDIILRKFVRFCITLLENLAIEIRVRLA